MFKIPVLSICLFPVHNKYGLLQPHVRGNDRHTKCAYTPVLLLGLTSASTWLVYMHVTELHIYKCAINMVFKAILCNKHNTDMQHTDDYMVV